MKKRFLSIMLVMILAVTNLSVCYADGLNDLLNIGLGTEISGDLSNGRNNGGDKDPARVAGEEDTATGIIKTVVNILTWIPKAIINLLLWICQLILPTMDVVVFNEGASIWRGFLQLTYFDDNIGGELAGNLRAYISALYQVFRYVALIGFVVAIACIAVKMIFSSIGKQKQQYKEALKSWLIGLVLLVVGHWIMIYAIYFSDYLVDLLRNIKNSVLSTSGALLTFAGGGEAQTLNGAFANALGSSDSGGLLTLIPGAQLLGFVWAILAGIAIILFIGMNLKVFKIYFERVVIVGVLIVIFPLVTVFYAFEKAGLRKGTSSFQSWWRTFIDQVFIQPVHALSLLLVILVLDALANTEVLQIPIFGVVLVLMAMNLVFSIENVVKRVFAINGASLGSPVDAAKPAKFAWKHGSPAAIHGLQNGFKTFSEMKGQPGRWGHAIRDAVSSTGKYLTSSQSKNRVIEGLCEIAGMPLPQGVLGGRMSMLEQRQAEKLMLKISGTSDLTTIAGQSTWDTQRKLMQHLDPDRLIGILKKIPLSEARIREIALTGVGNENELAMYKLFSHALVNSDMDIDAYMPGGQVDVDAVAGLGYDDGDINAGVEEARDIDLSNIDMDLLKKSRIARKAYFAKNSARAERIMSESGLTPQQIIDIESGVINNSDELLAYKIMMERIRDAKLSQADFYDIDGVASEEIYNGIIMDSANRVSNANYLKGLNDTDLNNNSTLVRSVLESFSKVNEDRLNRCANAASVNPILLRRFIEGDTNINIPGNELRNIFENLLGNTIK